MSLHPLKAETTARGARMLRTAFGPSIDAWLEEPTVVEVMLNPDGRLWVDRLTDGLADTGQRLSHADSERIVRLVAHHVGAEVHAGSPCVSAELPETGERFEGLLSPVVAGPTFAIRKPAVAVFTLADYVASGIMTAGHAPMLRAAVAARQNILVAGGTSTGKTALTNALLAEVATEGRRVVLIEDTRELRCRAPNLVALRTKDGVASLSDLVRRALRLRPDRIPIGEVRGAEARRLPARAYPSSHFPDPVSELMDAERRAQFEEAGAHFESAYVLTFVRLPPADDAAKAEGWLYEGSAADGCEALRSFIDRTDRVLDLIEAFVPEAAWLSDAETLTYLHSTVSTRHHRVRVPETPMHLDALLVDEPLTGGLAPRLGAAHLRLLTIIGFPTATFPGTPWGDAGDRRRQSRHHALRDGRAGVVQPGRDGCPLGDAGGQLAAGAPGAAACRPDGGGGGPRPRLGTGTGSPGQRRGADARAA